MVACPDETPAQMEATLSLLGRLRPDHIFCSKYHPLPGTRLGEIATVSPPGDLQRFDDYRTVAGWLVDPRCLDDGEHAELFARFDALKQELAARKAGTSVDRAADAVMHGTKKDAGRSLPRVDRLLPDQVATLTTSLGASVPGWSVASACRDDHVLLVALSSPDGDVELEVTAWEEGARSFARRDGLCYSYRGSIERAAHGELGRVIDAIHPVTDRLMVEGER
jgi:hypothetical protein